MFTMEVIQGQQAVPALGLSGFLKSDSDLPVSPEDLFRFLNDPDTYAIIARWDGVPFGYVVCCKRYMEHETPELFVLQIYGLGDRAWVTKGWECLHRFAAKLGCYRIGAVLPYDNAPFLARRFGLEPQGVYATTLVRGDGEH